MLLPGGNFLNPIVLEWFLPLAERHRLYASDVVGQPGKSAQERPSPKGDGHAFWVEDVLDGLGLARAPLVGISYGAGIAIRTMGLAPERVSKAALVVPSGIVAVRASRMLGEVAATLLLYRLRPTHERLLRAAHTDGARGPRLRPRRLADRGRLQAPQARRRAPRRASKEELANFRGPVAVYASEEDAFFPARAVLPRAREIFPNLALAQSLGGCRHVPSKAALGRVNERVLAFLAGPEETYSLSRKG